MDKEITALIVDDEQEAIDYLSILLTESFPEIKICATARNSKEAINAAFRKHPDLIFLDIKIDTMNGFDIVKELKHENHLPHIIFVTAYNKYAVEAFKTNAIDYLLKPVDPEDLTRAVNRFSEQKEKELQLRNIQNLLTNYQSKIRFNTRNGFILINPNDIIYCQADGNYTKLFSAKNSFQMVSVNLAIVEQKLPANIFRRISRSVLINENFLAEVDRKQRKCVLIHENRKIELPASSNRLKQL